MKHLPPVEQKVWAIRPETLRLLQLHMRGEGAGQVTQVEPAPQAAAGPSIEGQSVALLHLRGVITPFPTFRLFGEDSDGLIGFRRNLREAAANPDIGTILINIDSPGGSIDLVPETAADVRAAREQKPVIAVANTMAGSAAYWIASQATELVVTPSGDVGSIGVFVLHEEFSAMDKRMGIETTLIKAGRHKAEGNPYQPLTEEARQHFQELVDFTYDEFVADVAVGRGVSTAKVLADFGEGRMVRAEQAVAAGMADRAEPIEEVLAGLLKRRDGRGTNAAVQPAPAAEEISQHQISEGENDGLAQIVRQLDETTTSLKEDK